MSTAAADGNPVLEKSSLPLSFPHFDKIKSEQFRPAFEAAMAEHSTEIAAIADYEAEPTFDNVLVALEKAGLRRAFMDAVRAAYEKAQRLGG